MNICHWLKVSELGSIGIRNQWNWRFYWGSRVLDKNDDLLIYCYFTQKTGDLVGFNQCIFHGSGGGTSLTWSGCEIVLAHGMSHAKNRGYAVSTVEIRSDFDDVMSLHMIQKNVTMAYCTVWMFGEAMLSFLISSNGGIFCSIFLLNAFGGHWSLMVISHLTANLRYSFTMIESFINLGTLIVRNLCWFKLIFSSSI